MTGSEEKKTRTDPKGHQACPGVSTIAVQQNTKLDSSVLVASPSTPPNKHKHEDDSKSCEPQQRIATAIAFG